MSEKVFITGDCHHDFTKFNIENFPEQKALDKDDYVIICGDFGGIWNVGWENRNEKYWLDWLENKPFTTLFCDGNHENFDRLYTYPVKEWHGGKVHKIRPSVLHLMRGEFFNIAEKEFFVFGGAACHDVDDGILDTEVPGFKSKMKWLDETGGLYRINHLSWWKEELPSEEEIESAAKNLELHHFKTDFIITHCIYPELQEAIVDNIEYNILTEFLQTVKDNVSYQKWFFGHYHKNKCFTEEKYAIPVNAQTVMKYKEILLYDDIIPIL